MYSASKSHPNNPSRIHESHISLKPYSNHTPIVIPKQSGA